MKEPEIPRNIFRGWRKLAHEMIEFVKANRPIDGPGIRFNEMPDGRQGVTESPDVGTPTLVAMYVNGESGYGIFLASLTPRELP